MDNRNKSQLAVIILGIVLIIAAAIFAIWVASPQKEEAAAPDARSTSATATTTPVASTPTLSETALADGTCTTAAEVDRTNPEKLIQGFLKIGYCWDSTQDANTTVALLRGKELMTEEYAASLDPNVRNSMNADFMLVSQSQAYSTPVVDFAPDEGETQWDDNVLKDMMISWSWTGRDGTFYEGGRALVSVSAIKNSDNTWSISGMQVNSVESNTVPAAGINQEGN